MKRNSWFNIFAKASAHATGRPVAFTLALGTIILLDRFLGSATPGNW